MVVGSTKDLNPARRILRRRIRVNGLPEQLLDRVYAAVHLVRAAPLTAARELERKGTRIAAPFTLFFEPRVRYMTHRKRSGSATYSHAARGRISDTDVRKLR